MSIDTLNSKYIDIQGVAQTFKTRKGLFPALRNIHLRPLMTVAVRFHTSALQADICPALANEVSMAAYLCRSNNVTVNPRSISA
jgi:hypothetical protein